MKQDKITRDGLRAMTPGEVLTVECKDMLDLDSQRNTAYWMSKQLGCRFACYTNGLSLTITRHDDEH